MYNLEKILVLSSVILSMDQLEIFIFHKLFIR